MHPLRTYFNYVYLADNMELSLYHAKVKIDRDRFSQSETILVFSGDVINDNHIDYSIGRVFSSLKGYIRVSSPIDLHYLEAVIVHNDFLVEIQDFIATTDYTGIKVIGIDSLQPGRTEIVPTFKNLPQNPYKNPPNL